MFPFCAIRGLSLHWSSSTFIQPRWGERQKEQRWYRYWTGRAHTALRSTFYERFHNSSSSVRSHWRSRTVEKVRAKWIATQCKHSPPVTIATSLHPSTHRSWMNVKAEQYSERRRMAQNQRKLVNVQNESMKHGKPSKAKLSRLAPFYIPNPHLNWNSNHHPSQPFTPGQRQTVIAAQPWKDRYPAPHRQTEVQLP